MRLRNKPWVKEFLSKNEQYLVEWTNKETYLNFENIFNNTNDVVLEIGCGKGNFISQHAINNPKINFIGMEKETTVVGVALKKSLMLFIEQNKVMNNLKYFNYFAEDLSMIFPPQSIAKIFLNFSDPWPKTKHEYKRLTHNNFLNIYAKIIKPNGLIEFKTDNDKLFEFSLEQINNNELWEIVYSTTDLYADDEQLVNNVPTEYETKFHTMGKNINKLIIRLK